MTAAMCSGVRHTLGQLAECPRSRKGPYLSMPAKSLAEARPIPVDEPVISTVCLFMLLLFATNERSERCDDDSVDEAVLERRVAIAGRLCVASGWKHRKE